MEQFSRYMMDENIGKKRLSSDNLRLLKGSQSFSREKVDREYLQMPRESDLSECLTGTSILSLAPKLPSQARPIQQRPPDLLSCFLGSLIPSTLHTTAK